MALLIENGYYCPIIESVTELSGEVRKGKPNFNRNIVHGPSSCKNAAVPTSLYPKQVGQASC